jgi:lipopolysaccharide biosynthesis regulator YciM
LKKLFWVRRFLPVLFCFGTLFSCVQGPEEETLHIDYYNLAREFYDLGDYDRAEYYYSLVLGEDSSNRESRYNLALLYLKQGEGNKALGHLKKLYAADEANLSVMNSIGIAYSLKEEWEDALEWYGKVLELFPWDETALYNGALIYTKQENTEESLKWLEKLWERDKSYQTAMALWERTSDKTAEERRGYLEEAETSDEDEIKELDIMKFDFYLSENYTEEALLLVDNLKEEDSENEGWYCFKEGELLLSLYRIEEGLAAVREAFRKGFHESADLEAFAEQLSPGYREVFEELEELYFSK